MSRSSRSSGVSSSGSANFTLAPYVGATWWCGDDCRVFLIQMVALGFDAKYLRSYLTSSIVLEVAMVCSDPMSIRATSTVLSMAMA